MFVGLLHAEAIKKNEPEVVDVHPMIELRLKRTAEMGLKWLPRNHASALGDCIRGDDDSDIDEEDADT